MAEKSDATKTPSINNWEALPLRKLTHITPKIEPIIAKPTSDYEKRKLAEQRATKRLKGEIPQKGKSGFKKRELKLTISRALSDEDNIGGTRSRSLASLKRAKLKENRDRNDDLVAQLRGKNDDLRREVDRRSRVQEMLKSYKEEVETLQEALFIAAQTTASDAASLLPPETIDSLTSQYMSSKTFDNGDGYSHNFVEQQTRPTNLIVEEDGSVRTKR